MTPWQRRADALTQRMAEDMLLRNLSQKTIGRLHVSRASVRPVPETLARVGIPRRRAIVSTAPDS